MVIDDSAVSVLDGNGRQLLFVYDGGDYEDPADCIWLINGSESDVAQFLYLKAERWSAQKYQGVNRDLYKACLSYHLQSDYEYPYNKKYKNDLEALNDRMPVDIWMGMWEELCETVWKFPF